MVAPVTLNCFEVLLELLVELPVALELEFIPEFAPADVDPGADALAPLALWSGDCVVTVALAVVDAAPALPVTCTSFPIRVRMLSRLPVSV